LALAVAKYRKIILAPVTSLEQYPHEWGNRPTKTRNKSSTKEHLPKYNLA
jgi:hypothetical protein